MLLAEHAKRARHVAGPDASDLQLDVARQRLADRLAAGTAELVKGDAAALPWADGRFGVVTSMFCLKFVPDPLKALEEMFRVLRPGGRAVVALCDRLRDDKAGFADVTSSVIGSPASQLVQGVRVA
jgi:demethylmenaquinone methyltransferase/2-methoxy-6-polyprenyl-1,4-benzoquinol methylase